MRLAMISFLFFLTISFDASAQSTVIDQATSALREIIVSHGDENNVLQLYYIKEDGSSRR
ncbi:MAG: hypothetical protein ACKVH8_11620 [Pirellulales bacterium]